MRKITILAATAIVASLAAGPVLAKEGSHQSDKHKSMKMHKAGKQARAQQWRNDRSADARYNRGFSGGYDRGYATHRGYDDNAFWPANAAIGIAAGAVNTAGAIATAPFRDTYAYDNDFDDSTPVPVYRSTSNDNWGGAWNTNWDNGWAGQSYAQRNGFVCTPGTWFTNSAGYTQLCQ